MEAVDERDDTGKNYSKRLHSWVGPGHVYCDGALIKKAESVK